MSPLKLLGLRNWLSG